MTPDQFDVVSQFRAWASPDDGETTEKTIERFLADEIQLGFIEFTHLGLDLLKKARAQRMQQLREASTSEDKEVLMTAIARMDRDIVHAVNASSRPTFIVADKESNEAPSTSP